MAGAPFNTTTLGNFARITLTSPSGEVQLKKCYDFEFERMEERVHRGYISGERDKFSFPNGWSGSFNFDRTDYNVEQAFVLADQRMDTNGDYNNWLLTVTITDPNGASQDLSFHGCAFTLSKGGSYKQNGVVTSTLHFEAATMNYAGVAGNDQ